MAALNLSMVRSRLERLVVGAGMTVLAWLIELAVRRATRHTAGSQHGL